MPSPWVTRAQRAELPASDRTFRRPDRADFRRDEPTVRVDTGAGTYSIADLQRAVAREDAGR